MISLSEVESWVRAGESETLELKRTTGERRESARTICAMLNCRGGRWCSESSRIDESWGRWSRIGRWKKWRRSWRRSSRRTEFLDNRQFHGNVFDLLLKAERFLRENLPVAGRIQPSLFERIDDPLYPPVALREALANAFCHRDYSIGGGSVSLGIYDDRLEITSSGTLHFGLTPEALFLPHESLPWNPLIARVFYRRGIIEAWGRGTIKIEELTLRAGLARPEIVEQGGCVTVRFAPGRYVPPQRVAQDVSERQQRVLAFLAGRPGGAPVRDIAVALGLPAPSRSLREDLTTLKRLGLVAGEGWGRGARWRLA